MNVKVLHCTQPSGCDKKTLSKQRALKYGAPHLPPKKISIKPARNPSGRQEDFKEEVVLSLKAAFSKVSSLSPISTTKSPSVLPC